MIEGRVIIPKDVFVTLCVEHTKLADLLLKCAGNIHREFQAHHAPQTLDVMLEANVVVGGIERILKVITEENMPASPTSGDGGPGGEPANVQ